MTDFLHRLLEHPGQLQATLTLAFQQMERHALCTLAAHARQATQRFDQFVEEWGAAHDLPKKKP
jgi:hypothetical protein